MTLETEQKPRVLRLRFGAMSPTIAKQLAEQEYAFDKETVGKYQKIIHSIIMLRVHSYISLTIASRLEKKLFRQIEEHIKKRNK